MDLRRLPILLFAILIVAGCDNDDSARPIDPPVFTTDELVIADCYVLRDALEAFAAENGGVYPYGLTDQSDAGNQFITFLPGDTRLTNRYTGLATAPNLYGFAFYDAQWPGEIGVVRYSEESGSASGYRIVGRGRYGELVRIENLSQISQPTIDAYDQALANCDSTVMAAKEFARLAGRYPANLSEDTPSGITMIDLLPNAELLLNPFSAVRTDPMDGNSIGVPGGVGYLSNDRNADGSVDGFVIDAYGADGSTIALRTPESPEHEDVRFAAFALNSAVEDFASQNAGEYPRDLDTDQTPSGDTLRDLAFNRLNPYTGASAYRDGLATSRGEVGYAPVEDNGIVVGYVINALGLFEEELERFEVLTN